MSDRVRDLHNKAEQCRRLARSVDDKKAFTELNALAEEYEAEARQEEADTKREYP